MAAQEPFEQMEQNGVPKVEGPTGVAAPEKQEQQQKDPLPKLTSQEFKVYNHMAEHMDMFHEHFRQTWNNLHSACTNNKRPAGMSIRQFITTGLELCRHLTVHHTIEEQSIFPVLARRMDIFKPHAELLTQHEGIHEGLVKFEGYLEEVRSGERNLDLRELGEIMNGFGEVLWTHLDAEVKALGAENMRHYWSMEEMRRMPM